MWTRQEQSKERIITQNEDMLQRALISLNSIMEENDLEI
jgi:hypothetical protein